MITPLLNDGSATDFTLSEKNEKQEVEVLPMFGQETISPKVDVDKMEKLKFNKMLLSDK